MLIEINLFCLLPIDNYTSAKIVSIGIIIISIIYIMINPNFIFNNRGYFSVDICIFIFMCLFQCILTELKYQQGFSYIFRVSIYYFTLLIYLLLSYFLRNDYKKIKGYFKNVSLFFSIILILQYFLYNELGITFLKLDLSIGQRFGQARISVGIFMIVVGVVLSVSSIIKCINNKEKLRKIDLLVVVLGLIDVIFVSKTRSIIISLIVSILGMSFLLIRNKKTKAIIIILLIITGGLVINTEMFNKFVNLKNTEYSENSNIRQEASKYYIEKIKESPIVGIGFLHSKNKYDPAYSFLRGEKGKYFLDDVGIIGFTTTFGIIGLIWYLIIILKCFKIIIKKFKYKTIYDNGESVGLFIFILLSTFTIIFTDSTRIFYFAFILYFIEGNKCKVIMKK